MQQTLKQHMAEKLDLSTAREYTKASEGKYKNYLEHIFNGQHRIYIPLELRTDELEVSPLMTKIADHIKEKGVQIDQFDYLNGKILSNKNIMNIGRLLNDDKNLQTQFMNDPMRIKDGTCEIVISRHPYDVAGMTTDRGWPSCMDIKTGKERSFVKEDIKYGTLVAYLISKNDKNINRPLSRILIKPYIKNSLDNVAYGTDIMYGIEVPFFYNTVDRWVNNNLNVDKNGIYSAHPELYKNEEAPEEVILGKVSIDDYIKGAKVNEDGYIVIPHSIRLNRDRLRALRIKTLPFKGMKVIVEGDFTCDNCNLTTLEGAPSIVRGQFDASYNQLTNLEHCPIGAKHYMLFNNPTLTSLKGAPEEVSGEFNVYRCGLTTLEGAPRKIGGKFDCTGNTLTSLLGAPEDIDTFNCSSCNLDNLKGCPKVIKGNFICSNNFFKDFKFGPDHVEISFICRNVPLVSLQGIPKYVGMNFILSTNLGGHRFTEDEIRKVCKVMGTVESDRVF